MACFPFYRPASRSETRNRIPKGSRFATLTEAAPRDGFPDRVQIEEFRQGIVGNRPAWRAVRTRGMEEF